jgi:hypothetical protein
MDKLSRPSSTITAAALAGMFMTVVWGVVKTFMPEIELDPMLVSGSTTFASALVGYLKKENVLKAEDLG